MKTNKHKGLSLIVSLGASMMVLGVAVATMQSVVRSLEQTSSTERTTQLFFASESGIESAFFHHDARGQGVQFLGNNAELQLDLPGTSAQTTWEIQGRSPHEDVSNQPFSAGILKEYQTISIPLSWDNSTLPSSTQNSNGEVDSNNDDISFTFLRMLPTSGDQNIQDFFQDNYPEVQIPAGFDFGNTDQEILIDWALSRKHSTKGIQTFSPTERNDCDSPGSDFGFICEDDLLSQTPQKTINTSDAIGGRILPGNVSGVTLDNFFDCDDVTVAGGNCSDFKLTIRSLLKYQHSTTNSRIAGIPFIIRSGGEALPEANYTINSNVTMGDFVQNITVTVPERTAIGAFDYVIFD